MPISLAYEAKNPKLVPVVSCVRVQPTQTISSTPVAPCDFLTNFLVLFLSTREINMLVTSRFQVPTRGNTLQNRFFFLQQISRLCVYVRASSAKASLDRIQSISAVVRVSAWAFLLHGSPLHKPTPAWASLCPRPAVVLCLQGLSTSAAWVVAHLALHAQPTAPGLTHCIASDRSCHCQVPGKPYLPLSASKCRGPAQGYRASGVGWAGLLSVPTTSVLGTFYDIPSRFFPVLGTF